MKKLIYTLTAIATLAFAAGCANKLDGPNPVKGEFVETTFTVALDDAVATKAAINNDGKLVDKLTICAFKNDGTYLPDLNEANGNFVIEGVDVTGTKAQFSVKAKLVRNYPYKLAFFAFKEGAPYTLSKVNDKPVITMTGANANDESLDAFFFVTDDENPVVLNPDAEGGLSKTFTLTRPLAQINILSDPADWTAASTTGILAGLKSSVSIAKAPNVLNLVDGTVSGETTLAFEETIAPEGTINVAAPEATAVNAHYVAMAYVLSSAAANPVNVTFTVNSNDTNFEGFTRTVKNVPNKRNFRTNLHGDLFTVTGDFTVELDGAWEGNDDNQSINIPTPTITNPTSVPSGITATLPTITTGNNVTTTVAAGPLYFGIGADDTDSNGAITYSSSNHDVGTIDNQGVFTPVGAGNTNITITQAAGTATKAVGDPRAEITIVFHVTVEGPAEYNVTISNLTGGEITATPAKGVENAEITLTVAPAEGKQLKAGTLKYTPEGGDAVAIDETTKKFNLPAANVTVSAEFEEIPATVYTVTVGTLTGGTITATPASGEVNAEITLTVAPAEGKQLKAGTLKYTPEGGDAVAIDETTKKFNLPAANVTVSAEFEEIPVTKYSVNFASMSNGSVVADKTSVEAGETVTLTVNPATNYQLKAGTLSVTNEDTVEEVELSGTSFVMPAADVEVAAEFELIPVKTLTKIEITTDPTKVSFTEGDTFVFDGVVTATFDNATPATEVITPANLVFTEEDNNVLTLGTSTLSTVGDSQIITISYTYGGVTKDAMYEISVAADTPTPSGYSITVTQPTGGTISLKNGSDPIALTENVASGIAENTVVTLVATPSSGYVFDSWIVKDVDNNTVTVTSNQFTMPAKNVTVTAVFYELKTATISVASITTACGNLSTTATTDEVTGTVDGLSISCNGIAHNTKNTPSGGSGDNDRVAAGQIITLKKDGVGFISNTNELSHLKTIVIVLTGTTQTATSPTAMKVSAGTTSELTDITLPDFASSSVNFNPASGSSLVSVNTFTYTIDVSGKKFFKIYTDNKQMNIYSISVTF